MIHDTPTRMMAKGVIRDVVEWKDSRTKLYWRLKRRLYEKKLMRRIEKTGAALNQGQKTELLRRWFTEHERSKEGEKFRWENDKPVAEWLEMQINGETVIQDYLKMMKFESMMSQFRHIIGQMSDDELNEAGIYLAQRMSPTKKEEFAEAVAQIRQDDEEADHPNTSEAKEKQKDESSASENGEV